MEEKQGNSSDKRQPPKIVAAWFSLTTARERLIVLVGVVIIIVGLVARYVHIKTARENYQQNAVTEFRRGVDYE